MFGLGQLIPEDLKTRVSIWLVLGAPDQPSRDEIWHALCHARYISSYLHAFRRSISQQYPHRTDLVDLADTFEKVLRSEHGGELPETLFEDWGHKRSNQGDDRIHFTPGQRKTLHVIHQRWKDKETVRKEFSGLVEAKSLLVLVDDLNPKRVERMASFMREWIRSHKCCPAY
jgi:hypothetical protein